MEAFLNIICAALEQLMCECDRLRDYLQNNVAGSGVDIPDEVWVPFTAALAFAEKASTSANKQSTPCHEQQWTINRLRTCKICGAIDSAV